VVPAPVAVAPVLEADPAPEPEAPPPLPPPPPPLWAQASPKLPAISAAASAEVRTGCLGHGHFPGCDDHLNDQTRASRRCFVHARACGELRRSPASCDERTMIKPWIFEFLPDWVAPAWSRISSIAGRRRTE